MCGEEFNLSEVADTLKSGFKTLREKRDSLVQQQVMIEEDLDKTTKEMAKLDVMLRAYDLAGEKDKPDPVKEPITRVRGVKKALKKIASELTIGIAWDESKLISMVQEQVPGAKESSIKDSIRTLSNEDILNRYISSEGIRVCETTIGKPPGEGIASGDAIKAAVKVGAEDGSTVLNTQEAKQYNLLPGSEIVVMGEAEIIVAIEKEMKKRNSFPISEKNIGWIAADLGVEPKNVRDATKVMVCGDWEFAYEGETKVLRHKADPGSKEELKQTQIKDKPLFPGADRPPFA